LECPFCARYHESVVALRKEFGSDLEFVFVHSPLPQHRFAVDAARAAECAHRQGRFSEFAAVAYARQDSLGMLPWSVLAARASVPEVDEFDSCIADPSSMARVDSGRAASSRLRIQGTPTFVVNGHLVAGGGPDTLRALILHELSLARKSR
jgi:protein-disulfide isomerase